MEKIQKIRLNQLNKAELEKRQLNMVNAGGLDSCICVGLSAHAQIMGKTLFIRPLLLRPVWQGIAIMLIMLNH